ncbi:MAG TPA: YciI family protein [Polyangiaceae bacterium]|nr:YciI family protein [Polyangiaceae bacterium]
MQFLMLIKIANNADYEAGEPPPPELEAAMGELMGQWSKAGAMVSAAGLRPTSRGARVRSSAGQVKVSDGPFTEAKEVIGGFFVLQVEDKATATEMTRRFVELHQRVLGGDFQLECELREIEG